LLTTLVLDVEEDFEEVVVAAFLACISVREDATLMPVKPWIYFSIYWEEKKKKENYEPLA